MQYVRLRSYYPDGRFTSCEHLYHGRDQVKALLWFKREYSEHNFCVVLAEPYESDDPKNREHYAACLRCGCVH